MNNECRNQVELNLIDLIKYVLKNVKKIFEATAICTLIAFGITQFILPKSYSSSAIISIIPNGELLDYTSYLTATSVLESVSTKLNVDVDSLIGDVLVTRDTVNVYNYTITATTNNPDLSCRIVKNLVKSFRTDMKKVLNLNSITTINNATVNKTPVSPSVKSNTIKGAIIGFVFSFAAVVLSFFCNKHLRNSIEAEAYLGVDVLGEIPLKK